MAQNECLLSNSSSSNNHFPKQEPTELQYDYPQIIVEKRSSWAPPAHHNHKRDSSQSYVTSQQVAPPPMAHSKIAAVAATSWGPPIYRQTHQSNTPHLGGSPGTVLQQEIYAPNDAMYRRPTVFVAQAPYQGYNRVVPPPAHNASSRQVSFNFRTTTRHPAIITNSN